MPPRDIASLVDYLIRNRAFAMQMSNLLAQWGPANRRLLGAELLPPRLVQLNEDTIERFYYRTVAAEDGTRHSPAQLADGGELFGKVRYRLRHSDIARQITGPDYDAYVRYLARNESMRAIANLVGWSDAALLQALVEHDELLIWEAVLYLTQTRRGDNGYFSYEEGPDIANHRVEAAGDWSDESYDPWPDIFARVQALTSQGFEKSGIRIFSTDQSLTLLKANPYTAVRAGKVMVGASGGSVQQIITGAVTDENLGAIFNANGLQAPVAYDLWVPTRTGQKRAFDEGHMAFVATTPRSEEVLYNESDPTQVKVVTGNLGFFGIGIANGQSNPGRQVRVRPFTEEKAARIEGEAWQTSGPVITDAEAIKVLFGIQ